MRRFIVLGVAVVIVCMIVFEVIGLATLEVKSPQVTALRPALDNNPAAISRASINLLRGDLAGAAKSVVKGVEFDLRVQVSNSVPIPLYIPGMNHQLLVNGIGVTEHFRTPGTWIGPASTSPVAFNILVPFDRLDDAAIGVLLAGGTLDLATESKIMLGVTTVTKRTDVLHYSVSDTLKSVLDRLLRR
jgi:LEA14-like dessication related protein